MKTMLTLVAAIAAAFVLAAGPAIAQDRYATRPPVVLSPDLSAPWVRQLRAPVPETRVERRGLSLRGFTLRGRRQAEPAAHGRAVVAQPRAVQPVQVQPASRPVPVSAPQRAAPPATAGLDPIFLPQTVAYSGGHAPGTIVIDTSQRFLYLVGDNGEARRYGVGVGKEGFGWTGTEKITRKAEWPGWTPPAAMITRERARGNYLPAHMPGGPENPLGARALYLGSTLYRIHGTNQPTTIGRAVSSGCIRMRNEDVIDLYTRVNVGADVVVM